MNILFIGFKKVGKSLVAKKLSEILQKKFIDTDEIIKDLFFNKYQRRVSIFEVFKDLKEEKFRKLESIVISAIHDEKDAIISLGGGAVCNQGNISNFKDAKIIYLQANKDVLKKRILKEQESIFIDDDLFEKIFVSRKTKYETLADITIDTDNKDLDAIIHEIKEKIHV